jgi:hypothetical protein
MYYRGVYIYICKYVFDFIQAIGVRGFHAMLTPCELKDQICHSFGEAVGRIARSGVYAAASQLAWINSGLAG